jgi:GTPase SAR1 family protein
MLASIWSSLKRWLPNTSAPPTQLPNNDSRIEYKVVTVGRAHVGKTSIITTLVHEKWIDVTNTTIASFNTKQFTIDHSVFTNKFLTDQVKLFLWGK